MGDAATGQRPFDTQEAAEKEANAEHAAEDKANAGQEPETHAKPGPPRPGDDKQESKPESKFHG
jgi:hypothetical protein